MGKKVITIVLALLMLLGSTVYAVEPRTSAIPTLTFSQSTANCSATVSSTGHYIEATLALWYGDSLIDSWEGSGENNVYIKGSCTVTRRRNYTLVVSGTIDGIEFEESVTRTCS